MYVNDIVSLALSLYIYMCIYIYTYIYIYTRIHGRWPNIVARTLYRGVTRQAHIGISGPSFYFVGHSVW